MANRYICHYGTKGMKWGVRKKIDRKSYKKDKKEALSKYKQDKKEARARYSKKIAERDKEYGKQLYKWDPTGIKQDKLELIGRQKKINQSIIDYEEEQRGIFDKESTKSILARIGNREMDTLEKEISKGKPVFENIDWEKVNKKSYLPKKEDYTK